MARPQPGPGNTPAQRIPAGPRPHSGRQTQAGSCETAEDPGGDVALPKGSGGAGGGKMDQTTEILLLDTPNILGIR